MRLRCSSRAAPASLVSAMTRRSELLGFALPYLFTFCIVGFHIYVSASIEVTDAAAKNGRVDGCVECGDYRCPGELAKCLLGPVADPCDCCKIGICARLDGESCWNSSIPTLPLKRRNDGVCATNYVCKLRSDLRSEEEPQAVCVCMEQGPACGSDNKTYATPCVLHEEAMRRRNSTLRLQYLGPCQSRPWILSRGEKLSSVVGEEVGADLRGGRFFYSRHRLAVQRGRRRRSFQTSRREVPRQHSRQLRPGAVHENVVAANSSRTKEHTGSYECIAKNSIGEANSASFLVVF